ncbi:bifunctional DNA-binding transcriptional regulator/O6-methylguanine-DNA methyltransferase Ada [Hoeflea prorocentri]|uniref:Regulatory protein of adaptive response n=1 Tax=Hoeflea prorocentri TaxID=1922333 RepID=A0A9X3ZG21_9HYPH|nr:bifunctional DNA-binding transcriptional regulator/O6-methylguanine-DNA methyltransferase Ada [Hoeflea prorocentri]MCY6380292.1 bifunctional DNA-binding transcriptional regulator/O6-methylguanine-DNA methyltransferase Ada [Hoeflea prorocentri]MDA5398092.1 bifunctional DNA-binding transcriptional regulator/O6-methylguanine-DNA methyltransferase Ada [Hoeflea prorocentri]
MSLEIVEMKKQALSENDRWQAVSQRDASADGQFVFAVRTTGIYCRPSCSSKAALRRNVAFYDSALEAETAGYRPCKRCKPEENDPSRKHSEMIAAACRMIEQAEEPPSLEDLARHAGISRFYFHRLFKEITGITPKAYAAACRAARVRGELERGASVTGAIFDAGYNASSRFYEESDGRLGMRPTQFRDGGRDARIAFAVAESSLGPVLVAATERGVCAIDFGDDPDALVKNLQDRFPKADLVGGEPDFEQTVAAVIAQVEAPQSDFDLPLDIRGTAFQQKVWAALRAIPAGTTVSYSEVARDIGKPSAVRAVAQACGANRIAVAIPCHRVVRTDGALSGYRWGVERKRELLKREARS